MKMKIIIPLFIAGMFLLSCQKNIEDYTITQGANNGPDTTWRAAITSDDQVNVLRSMLQTPFAEVAVNGSAAITVQTNEGLRLQFPTAAFLSATGTVITGPLLVRTKLMRKRGEIIRSGFPTVSNGNQMVSAGELFVMAKKDSLDLSLAAGLKYTVNYESPTIVNDARIFNLLANTASIPPDWVANADTANNKVIRTTNGYELQCNRLGWMNAGRIINSSQTLNTRLTALLPSNYTNVNTLVFVAFNNQVTVSMMEPDMLARKFRSLPVPVGTEVTVIVLSRQVEDFYLGHSVLTVTAIGSLNETQQVSITPVKTNLDHVKLYLDNL